MKFKNPILKFVRTDGQAQSNMPLQLFQMLQPQIIFQTME